MLKQARVPDYFSEYKERKGELCCFLGGLIYAKVSPSPPHSRCVLTDSQLVSNDAQARLYVTKTEYNTAGPAHYRLLPMA